MKYGQEYILPVVAFYNFEPGMTEAPDFSLFHKQFIEESLTSLEYSLKKLNIPLYIFERNISEVLKYFFSKFHIVAVFSHEETGNALTYKRDILVGKYLQEKSIPWNESPTNGVVRRLKTRDEWSKIWENRMNQPLLPIPKSQEPAILGISGDIDWKKISKRNPKLQKGGESEGQKVLKSFLTSRGKQYMGGMSRPIAGMEASSRLSPYLAYGCLSLRQIVQMTAHRMTELKAEGDTHFLRSLQAFFARLHWHSHFIQKLESEPRFEYENAVVLYNSIRTHYDISIMDAVENAKTGIPFIDGVIRQLQATGWVNFRARATLVSFVVNTCMQPWQGRFAHWLARLFLDYEPGIHYTQLQMQSGTMGINTIRIYNPVKQLFDKDNDGRFISTWLPELAKLPKHLQAEPWKISPMESIEYGFILGRDYPFPIVDIEISNRKAREILYNMKKKIHPEIKSQILKKHGSRKLQKKKQKRKDTPLKEQNLTLF